MQGISIGGDALEDSSSNDCADARRSVSEPSDSFSHESRSHNEKSDESLKVKHDEEENVKRVVSFDDVKEESTKSLGKYATHSCAYSTPSNIIGLLLLKYLNNTQYIFFDRQGEVLQRRFIEVVKY